MVDIVVTSVVVCFRVATYSRHPDRGYSPATAPAAAAVVVAGVAVFVVVAAAGAVAGAVAAGADSAAGGTGASTGTRASVSRPSCLLEGSSSGHACSRGRAADEEDGESVGVGSGGTSCREAHCC